jgi:hypothetical protein
MKNVKLGQISDKHLTPNFTINDTNPVILVRVPTNEESDLKRPKAGGIAYPFSLQGHPATASMTTLTSEAGVPPVNDVRTEGVMKSGVQENASDIRKLVNKAHPILTNFMMISPSWLNNVSFLADSPVTQTLRMGLRIVVKQRKS